MKKSPTNGPTLLQQAYLDAAVALDAFGEMGQQTTAADVQKAHVLWSSIPEADRHMTALCFQQFDAQRDLFSAPPEAATDAPEV
jgi:hypothetical protein